MNELKYLGKPAPLIADGEHDPHDYAKVAWNRIKHLEGTVKEAAELVLYDVKVCRHTKDCDCGFSSNMLKLFIIFWKEEYNAPCPLPIERQWKDNKDKFVAFLLRKTLGEK